MACAARAAPRSASAAPHAADARRRIRRRAAVAMAGAYGRWFWARAFRISFCSGRPAWWSGSGGEEALLWRVTMITWHRGGMFGRARAVYVRQEATHTPRVLLCLPKSVSVCV